MVGAGSRARTIGHEYDLYPTAVCIINDPKFVALFGHLSYLHYYYIRRAAAAASLYALHQTEMDAERQMRPKRSVCLERDAITDTRIVCVTADGSYGIWNANRPITRKKVLKTAPFSC